MRHALAPTVALAVLAAALAAPLPPAPSAPASAFDIVFLALFPQATPADSQDFHLAVALAVDRRAIVAASKAVSSMPSHIIEATSIEDPRFPGYAPPSATVPFDPARAHELLAKSQWAGPLTITTPLYGSHAEILERALAESLSAHAGLAVSYSTIPDTRAVTRAILQGAVPAALLAWVRSGPQYSYSLSIARTLYPTAPALQKALASGGQAAAQDYLIGNALVIPILFAAR